MKYDITKVANTIVYMLDNKVLHLNDKKLSILLFLIDYTHLEKTNTKVFGDEYIKAKRQPEAKILTDLCDIMANDLDLDEEDERMFLIAELLDYVDIEIFVQNNFIELKFVKMDEEFDKSLFTKDEMRTIDSIINQYKTTTARNIANSTFQNEKVRTTPIGEVII